MKTVIFNTGITTNDEESFWEPFKSIEDCTIYHQPELAAAEILMKDAAIVVSGSKVRFTKAFLAKLPELKFICTLSTGYDQIDVAAASAQGVVVTNIPAYSTDSVAQLVFALLLELTHRVGEHDQQIKNGEWAKYQESFYWAHPLMELKAKTLGIIGFGAIGQRVAAIAQAFGMKVLAYTRHPDSKNIAGVSFVDLNTIFTESDVLTLHSPLTPETKHLVNAEKLRLMKPTAFLINTSRGSIIDEQALANALNQNLIAGAGIDVFSKEPAPLDNPLLSAKNCIFTPHIGWSTVAARKRLIHIAAANVKAFLKGTPQNTIN